MLDHAAPKRDRDGVGENEDADEDDEDYGHAEFLPSVALNAYKVVILEGKEKQRKKAKLEKKAEKAMHKAIRNAHAQFQPKNKKK